MPYRWITPDGDESRLILWPYRSLPRRGMVWFIAATALLVTLPLAVLLGSRLLWGVLPFFVLAISGVWWALQRSYRDAEILEDFTLSPTTARLTRTGPGPRRQEWQANRHWVRVAVYPKDGPVPNYLTLQGGPREVEIGAFLTEAERLDLAASLRKILAERP